MLATGDWNLMDYRLSPMIDDNPSQHGGGDPNITYDTAYDVAKMFRIRHRSSMSRRELLQAIAAKAQAAANKEHHDTQKKEKKRFMDTMKNLVKPRESR